jgi:DNA mismatch repair protein MutS2
MQPAALRALEFDRIREALARETSTPVGRSRALALAPAPDATSVARRLGLTGEALSFLNQGGTLSIEAPADLEALLRTLDVADEPLEPRSLLGLARALASVEHVVGAIRAAQAGVPGLAKIAATVESFAEETVAVTRAIDMSGDVTDDASPALRDIRSRLRRQRATLRTTLEGFARGRDTAKYVQDEVIADRNGRYVIVVRAEHRHAIRGLVHGSSASGASVYLEPLATVELNNDVIALVEREHHEVIRILGALTNAFRIRRSALSVLFEAAGEIDELQARARLARRMDGVAPRLVEDGRIEFRDARHPLLIPAVRDLLDADEADDVRARAPLNPVPSDLVIVPPTRALVISGPNTGGKTVALKAFGLLTVMAQAGLFVPADGRSTFTPFDGVFADIGDEQSISASLSTFSARVANIIEMERAIDGRALVLLDEVGSGTDPVEGGALGTAVIDHFWRRGALVVATTHDDALKSYAATTDGVQTAAFGFNQETYAPTYRLVYDAPGRSLALEVAERLGMPATIVADARARRSGRESQLAEHIAQLDAQLADIDTARMRVDEERAAVDRQREALLIREGRLAEREAVVKKRLNERITERLREARREVDTVLTRLRSKADVLAEQAERRARTTTPVLSTGEIGGLGREARRALGTIDTATDERPQAQDTGEALDTPPDVGQTVQVMSVGATGTVIAVSSRRIEVEVRGKRMRVPLSSLRRPVPKPTSDRRSSASRTVTMPPEGGRPLELMVIGATVDDAVDRAEKFLDDALLSDARRLRVIHGHGTGRLRQALRVFFREHPLVASVAGAPSTEGGEGATIVELKD